MSPSQTSTYTLYRGWPKPKELVISPFVTKVEFRLRHSNIKYTTEAGSTSQSPKGKIPYIAINDNGNDNKTSALSDSTLIIKQLTQEGHMVDLNASLSPKEQLNDLAIRALLEDKLYFYGMHERWVTNYYAQRDQILGHMSLPMRAAVGLLVYRNVKATLHGQGSGRFSEDELDMYRVEIWQTIEEQLAAVRKNAVNGNEPFWILGGSDPTEADATLFGFVTSNLVAPSCPRSKEIVRSMPAIMEYADRIMKKYFAEYQHWDD